MSKAIDMGNYYRIPCDTRDLNYDKFFTEGSEDVSKIEDLFRCITRRLDVEGMKEQLLRAPLRPRGPGADHPRQATDIRSGKPLSLSKMQGLASGRKNGLRFLHLISLRPASPAMPPIQD